MRDLWCVVVMVRPYIILWSVVVMTRPARHHPVGARGDGAPRHQD